MAAGKVPLVASHTMKMSASTVEHSARRALNVDVPINVDACDDHHFNAAHVLFQNKKDEVCGFSSSNAVLGQSSSSMGSEFNHD